jgi:biotin carboxyl carrier protein
MDTDEVVPLGRLRAWLELLVEAAWQSAGSRRTKNPRIWSIHDLEVLGGTRAWSTGEARFAVRVEGALGAPTVGLWSPAIGEGAPLRPGLLLGHVLTAGESRPVLAPDGVIGVATSVAPAGRFVDYGAPLLVEGEGGTISGPSAGATRGVSDLPEGVVAVCADTDGTFYTRGEPGAPPFVSVGQPVERSATVGLVEVMKTFSTVKASRAGVVERVLVGDGAPVTAGQALLWIRVA